MFHLLSSLSWHFQSTKPHVNPKFVQNATEYSCPRLERGRNHRLWAKRLVFSLLRSCVELSYSRKKTCRDFGLENSATGVKITGPYICPYTASAYADLMGLRFRIFGLPVELNTSPECERPRFRPAPREPPPRAGLQLALSQGRRKTTAREARKVRAPGAPRAIRPGAQAQPLACWRQVSP